MKKISLSIAAVFLLGAMTYANGPAAKTSASKHKQECAGQCRTNIKTNSCKDPAKCSDMNSCKNRCS